MKIETYRKITYTRKHQDIYENIVAWMNEQEFFYLKDCKKHFDCDAIESEINDTQKQTLAVLSHIIKALVAQNIIQCSKYEKTLRQYVRLRKIQMIDTVNSKY